MQVTAVIAQHIKLCTRERDGKVLCLRYPLSHSLREWLKGKFKGISLKLSVYLLKEVLKGERVRDVRHSQVAKQASNWPPVTLLSYPTGQKVTVRFGIHEASITLQVGVPQGSRLGPLLFTAGVVSLIEDLRKIEGADVVVTAYADDLTIILSGPSRKHIRALWAKVKKKLNKWCTASGLTIDRDKSSCLSPRRPPILSLRGEALKRSKVVRVLGVHLDQRMNFRYHVKKTCEAAVQRLGRLRRIGIERARLGSRGIIATYEKAILPFISYGVRAWETALEEEWCQNLLTRVAAYAARLATRAPRRASNAATVALSGLVPPHLLLAGLATAARARQDHSLRISQLLEGAVPMGNLAVERWQLHPLPPWDDGLDIAIQTEKAAVVFACLAPNDRAIYTDGSLTPSIHAGMAMVVYCCGQRAHQESYRVPLHCTVAQCEMAALERAVAYAKSHQEDAPTDASCACEAADGSTLHLVTECMLLEEARREAGLGIMPHDGGNLDCAVDTLRFGVGDAH
ncbi:conserved hypothetical protein [Perkinsus marinus ATCC 50983]|uniref:Reverse transcriptase domain-containing protein n=1 Tax=Perkinsus marinus (strain ATCC 50983 / TXsc) TaxID=423536 RepID=C5LIV3_PERM5|nr:conserved hypothetical protein [Perkinsus marinus ATCC 50983]EER03288.1 conserved hypothetical protein [Perkinsus marinus ATCC 50983]|eukprot:XP_002771472.1 conserved hypothetical protein [Perkinsus marinus ATCC 50983]